MISKELLSEVWKWKYATAKDCRVAGKHIEVTFNETNSKDKINIYELAHKCKEWALSNKFFLSSELFGDNEGVCYAYKKLSSKSPVCSCTSLTEPEAIFKACQWILENKDK